MNSRFSAQRFRHALTQTNNIQQTIQPFIIECNRYQMTWIIGILQELYQYLHFPKISINLAFNSLFAVKNFIDSGNIVIINLAEIYLLPKISKIAAYDFYGVSQRRAFSYFIDRGFQGKRSELQFYGHNYVRMANEIIIAGTQIKPFMLIENQESREPSEYSKALIELKKRGFQPYSFMKFYTEGQIQRIRQKYVRNLGPYLKISEKIGAFYADIVKNFLRGTPETVFIRDELHPNKLFKGGQLTICKKVLKECFTSLQSTNLNQRKRALLVINDFVKWGDVLVDYAINQLGVIDQVVREIADPHERTTSQARATLLLTKYVNTDEQKVTYYKELLRSVYFWALCFPYSFIVENQLSEINLVFILLDQKLDIEFPQFSGNINQNYAIFNFNSKQQKVRNDRIIKVFRQNSRKEQLMPSMLPPGVNRKMLSKKMSLVDEDQNYRDLFGHFADKSAFESFKEELHKVRKVIQDITHQRTLVKQYCQVLRDFINEFDTKIVEGNFKGHQLDYLINQGAPLIEKVEDIMPVIDKYNNGYLSYPQLRGYLTSYKQELHINTIEEVKMKKKQTILHGMGMKKEVTFIEKLPQIVLPYTESEDRLGPSYFLYPNRQSRPSMQKLETMQRLESHARDLFKINQDQMLNSHKSQEKMININKVKHLESRQEQFVDLQRITSLEGKMDRKDDSIQSNRFSLSNYRNSIPSRQTSYEPPNTKTNTDVYDKYQEGVLRITEMRVEEDIDFSSNFNFKSKMVSGGINGQFHLSVDSPLYNQADHNSKSDIISRLDKFMDISSVKNSSNRQKLNDHVEENSREGDISSQKNSFIKNIRKQAPLHKQSSRENPLNKTQSNILDQPSLAPQWSQIIPRQTPKIQQTSQKQQEKAEQLLKKKSSEYEKYQSSHRKTSSMGHMLHEYSHSSQSSEPQVLFGKAKILNALAHKKQKTENYVLEDNGRKIRQEQRDKWTRDATYSDRNRQFDDGNFKKSTVSSPRCYYEMGKQVFVQKGVYKQKSVKNDSSNKLTSPRAENKFFAKF